MKKTRSMTALLLIVLAGSQGKAQGRLDDYIRLGLANNVVLQQKRIDIEKATIALQTAKSYFLPTVNFSGTFSTAQGGRYADLPVGDLLNPVYATLNQMTGSSSFPQIANEQIDFLPQNYYDAYIRTTVPIVNTDIIYNRRIGEQRAVLSQLEADTYARQLVADIKTAYFNYLSAVRAVEIYEKTISVLEKNVALNEALLVNGKGLQANVLRAKSEREAVRAQMNQAENQRSNAQFYFNFLLNRELHSPIEEEDIAVAAADAGAGVAAREELAMLRQAQTIRQTVVDMNERFWVPKLNAFLDLGSQGVNWEVSSKSAYYMVGVSLSIPIYNGSRNTQQVKLSEWNLRQSELAIEQTTQQLSLTVQLAMNGLSTATSNYESSLERLQAAEEYFRLVSGAHEQGMASQIEFIDASTQLTQAELQVAISRQQINIALAALERETATYALPGSSIQKTN